MLSKINKQISSSNSLPYESTIDVSLVEKLQLKVPKTEMFFDLPVRMKQYLEKQGETMTKKKKGLLAKSGFEQIKNIERAKLMLESLDNNIYISLKNAYIFQDYRQLTAISTYLAKKEQAEMVFRSVSQRFGLDLVEKLP